MNIHSHRKMEREREKKKRVRNNFETHTLLKKRMALLVQSIKIVQIVID